MRRPAPWVVEALALGLAIALAAIVGYVVGTIQARSHREAARVSVVIPDPIPLAAKTCLQVRAAPDGSPFYVPSGC